MTDFSVWVTHGDDTFKLKGLMASEFSKVKKWTGGDYVNHHDWFRAILNHDPDAILAAFTLLRFRENPETRWGDVDVDLTVVESRWCDDDGRAVRMRYQTDDDGNLKVDDDGLPIPVRDGKNPVWEYVDTGDAVPPTPSPETTSTVTTPTHGGSSESGSGIHMIAVS